MSRRAFTAVELAICLSILIVLIPLVYAGAITVEETHNLGLWHLQSADQLRTVTEELRLDARRGTPVPDQRLSWTLDGCQVSYRVDDRGVLLRELAEPCHGTRGLATGVTAFDRVPGGVELELTRMLRPTRREESRFFIPLETP